METTIRMECKMRQQTLNKNLNVPLYVQLKELILGDIQNGTLSAGDMIPTEHELMEQFSISRNVVRQAIGELVEGGYLIRKKAKGTFVSTPSANVEKISTLEVFRESALRSGAIPTTKVLNMEVLDADEESAQRLGIAPGVRIIRIMRLHFANDVPTSISESVLPYARCGFVLEHRLQSESLHRVLSYRYDTRIYRSMRTMGARLATDKEVELLGIAPGSAVSCSTRKSYNRMNSVIESTISVSRGDFELSFETVETP